MFDQSGPFKNIQMVGYPGFGHPGQYLNGGGTQVRTGKYVHDPQTDGRRKGREYLALLGQNVLRRKTPDDLIDPSGTLHHPSDLIRYLGNTIECP